MLRAVEAGNDEAIRQVADIAEEEFPAMEPKPADVSEYAGDVPEIEFADAGAGPELAFEEAEPEPMTEDTEGPAAKKHAPDPYETQMLEAILSELESRD